MAAPRSTALRPTVLQPRVVAGQQLRRTLKQRISLGTEGKLQAVRKIAERAQAKPDLDIDESKHTARKLAALVTKRAQQMRTHFFLLGSWSRSTAFSTRLRSSA
jgi:hypothetical protein